ncbi:MAG: hypothetical protein HUU57_03780 [Bdellovibrio sp.]|nr:hypothetical protein [Bdellovibrio sp.]
MEKHVLLAMAVIMVLGSVKALAMSDQDLMDMNQQSKVEAMVRNQQMDRLDEVAHGNGQIQAAQKNHIRDLRIKSAQTINALVKLDQNSILSESGIGQVEDMLSRAFKVSKDSESSNLIQNAWELSELARPDLENIINVYNLKLEELSPREMNDLELF